MRSGRFVVLASVVAVVAVTAFAWARVRRAPPRETHAPAAAPRASAPVPPPRPAPAPPATAAVPPAVAPSAPVAAPAPSPIARQPRDADEAASAHIDALVRAGDIGRARDAAEEFLRRYPGSSYCQHVETLTGVHPRPPIPGE